MMLHEVSINLENFQALYHGQLFHVHQKLYNQISTVPQGGSSESPSSYRVMQYTLPHILYVDFGTWLGTKAKE